MTQTLSEVRALVDILNALRLELRAAARVLSQGDERYEEGSSEREQASARADSAYRWLETVRERQEVPK